MEIGKKIIRVDLDFSLTQEYFLDHINGGRALDKYLLEHLDFRKGFFLFYSVAT